MTPLEQKKQKKENVYSYRYIEQYMQKKHKMICKNWRKEKERNNVYIDI